MNTFTTTLFVFASLLVLSTGPVAADQCARMESDGRLIFQQFKKSKVCKGSDVAEGWTDCNFKAYGTEILLVGAIGTSVQARMLGFGGSGFYVLSVDKQATVRTLFDAEFGILMRIDGKDNLKESGCIYNEAYITLDAQVYGPGEFNRIKLGPVKLPTTEEDKTMALQKDLKLLGFYSGNINGVLGPDTIGAIANYKKAKGLAENTSIEDVRQLAAMDAAFKSLDEMKRLYEEGTAPKPPLRK